MANPKRGEVSLVVAGQRWTLCLTLGALAEIEAHFGVPDIPALGARLSEGRLGAQDIVAIIGSAARGGGMKVTPSELQDLPVASELPALMTAVLELFARAFPAEQGVAENPL